MNYVIREYRTEFYNKSLVSFEDKIINLFGEVCFYNGGKKQGGGLDNLMIQSPLHPKNVNPKNKKQVEKCFRDQIAYAEMLENSSSSPFTHPLVQRTHKEP